MAQMKKGTIHSNPHFDAEAAATSLHKAMKGIGTDEDSIIEVVTSHDSFQRAAIAEKYEAMYGRDLIGDLKSEISGKFCTAVKALFTPPRYYMAKCVYKAMKGIGTDETALTEILVGRSNFEMEKLKDAYKEKYESDLVEDIKSEVGGTYERVLCALLAGGREEHAPANFHQAQQDAQALFEAGASQIGTDESVFISILNTRSYAQLKEIFAAYNRIAEHDIEDDLKDEFQGNDLEALLGIVRAAKDTVSYFAKLLNKAVKGCGTDDNALIRILVSRSEAVDGAFQVDMKEIKAKYEAEYGVSLADEISSETSGDFEQILLKLIGGA